MGAAPARPCWSGEGSGATGRSRLAALQSRAESLEGRTVSSSFVSSVPTQSQGSLCTQKGATRPLPRLPDHDSRAVRCVPSESARLS